MKTQYPSNKPRVIAIPLGEEIRSERKLVLRRLKPPPMYWQRFWKAWFVSLRLIPNLFKNPDLMREHGPEKYKAQSRWYL